MLIIGKISILVLGEGSTQGLDDTTVTAENKYSINFTESKKIFFVTCSGCIIFLW